MSRDSYVGWTDEAPMNGATYSVIVVDSNPRPSNQFRDKQRVQYFSKLEKGGRLVSVQVANPFPRERLKNGDPPFFVDHPPNVDKSVRLIFVTDIAPRWPDVNPSYPQLSHLSAACKNGDESTIIVIVDETCTWTDIPSWLPVACSNVVRIYPFNNIREGTNPINQQAYIPLGPRNSFPFVDRGRVLPASHRPLFYNFEVTIGTSPHRQVLASIIRTFRSNNAHLPTRTTHDGFGPAEWQELLLNSTFTICPGGHNPETFRMWEALEAGSIPIVSKNDYTHPAYNSHNHSCGTGDIAWNTVAASPFAMEVSVANWHELPARLHELWKKPGSYLDKLQEDSMAWYAAMMRKTYDSLLDFGKGRDMYPQRGPVCNLFGADF